MSAERKPWLFLKRIGRWSPLADVRPMLAAMPGSEPGVEDDGPDIQARR